MNGRFDVRFVFAGFLISICCAAFAQAEAAHSPAVGEIAKDFELDAAIGTREGKVKLSDTLKSGPTVLVVLRGFPGYQCPICSRQVGSLIGQAREFKNHGANVLLIYPGPAKELEQHAKEFLKGSTLPAPFTLLLDPDYKFTNAYGLRWDAPRETAYPSTFVIDSTGKVRFAKISTTHGGRAEVTEVLESVSAAK